jgi:hypothetical protein
MFIPPAAVKCKLGPLKAENIPPAAVKCKLGPLKAENMVQCALCTVTEMARHWIDGHGSSLKRCNAVSGHP